MAVVPRTDGGDDLGTSIKRWNDVFVSGDISDGTNETNASEIKDAYDHSLVIGNAHSATAADVGADPTGTAASEMGLHEGTYDHTLIIAADPVGSAASAIGAHEITYDHTLIIAADPVGSAASAMSTHESTYDHTKIANAEKLQGRDISSAAPSDGKFLVWSTANNQWQAGDQAGLTSVTTDTTISGDGTGGDPLSVADDMHTHTMSTITDLGTAAGYDVPAVGNASATEVVIGTDTRLTNSRTPSAHKTLHELAGSDQINHDSLLGFVANEHIDHSAVSIVAGSGLNGGGTIDGNVTINLDPIAYILDCGAEYSDLSLGIVKTLRMPHAFTLTEIRASVTIAPTPTSSSSSSSDINQTGIEIDVLNNGVSVFSTLLTIDNYEKSSKNAAIPAVISTPAIADDDELQIEVTQVGSVEAGAGLKVYLIGTKA